MPMLCASSPLPGGRPRLFSRNTAFGSIREAFGGVGHIFPYRISDYASYGYVREWYFRCLLPVLFRWLERHFGWHLCLTAEGP